MRIRQTIPHIWRTILNGDMVPIGKRDETIEKLNSVGKLKTKSIYWLLLEKNHDLQSIPNAHLHWVQKYEFSEEMLKTAYTLPYKACKTTYIQSLQLKILYKVISCNYWVNKMKIIDSPQCRFCKDAETVEHFFFACKDTKLYWKSILNWWNHLDIFFVDELQEKSIIMGMPWTETTGKVFNCCILVGKSLVYRNKMQQKQPNLVDFLLSLKDYLSIEEDVSVKNNSYSTFEKEWGDITSIQ
jgi:hypothetical protein